MKLRYLKVIVAAVVSLVLMTSAQATVISGVIAPVNSVIESGASASWDFDLRGNILNQNVLFTSAELVINTSSVDTNDDSVVVDGVSIAGGLSPVNGVTVFELSDYVDLNSVLADGFLQVLIAADEVDIIAHLHPGAMVSENHFESHAYTEGHQQSFSCLGSVHIHWSGIESHYTTCTSTFYELHTSVHNHIDTHQVSPDWNHIHEVPGSLSVDSLSLQVVHVHAPISTSVSVPEPSTFIIMAIGFMLLLVSQRWGAVIVRPL